MKQNKAEGAGLLRTVGLVICIIGLLVGIVITLSSIETLGPVFVEGLAIVAVSLLVYAGSVNLASINENINQLRILKQRELKKQSEKEDDFLTFKESSDAKAVVSGE